MNQRLSTFLSLCLLLSLITLKAFTEVCGGGGARCRDGIGVLVSDSWRHVPGIGFVLEKNRNAAKMRSLCQPEKLWAKTSVASSRLIKN
jgi:hypothetical protein